MLLFYGLNLGAEPLNALLKTHPSFGARLEQVVWVLETLQVEHLMEVGWWLSLMMIALVHEEQNRNAVVKPRHVLQLLELIHGDREPQLVRGIDHED